MGRAVSLLQERSDTLVGDVLLSSGVVAYLGAFTLPFRRAAMESWMNKIHVSRRRFPTCT